MTDGVRPMDRDDLPGVRLLFEEYARAGGASPAPPVEDHLARMLLDHPWADPELPSLVHSGAGGEILGLVASFTRRMVCDGRPLRVRFLGGFVVSPRARGRGVGSELLDRYMAGPQDVTMSDGMSAAGRRRWTAVGGRTLVHASIDWRRVLRPGAAVAMSEVSLRRPTAVRRAVAALARPADAVVAAVPPVRRRVRPAPTACAGELLTPTTMATLVADGGRRLRPDYDAEYLDWLFTELEPAGLVRVLVRGDGGEPLGWYLYALADPARAQVLQVGATGPDGIGPVLDHLLADADARGAALVEGRLEPDLAEALRSRRTSLHPSSWVVVHTADPEIAALLGSSEGMSTRLDGEWWIAHLLWNPAGNDLRRRAAPAVG